MERPVGRSTQQPPSRPGAERDVPPAARSPWWRRGIPLGRLFGFPVPLSPSWLLLAGLLTAGYARLVRGDPPTLGGPASYAIGFGFVACLVASVLAHELGHALICRRHGI